MVTHLRISLLLIISFIQRAYSFSIGKPHLRQSSPLFNTETDDEDSKQPKKSTKLDRVISDFIGKRYGAGEAFYGKRVSDLDEDTYLELRGVDKKKEFAAKPLKDNAIAIFGDLDRIGQYIVFELAEKGFSIRILTENPKKATNLFGLPGNNVDIVELKKESPLEQYLKAIGGCQAVILCGNFQPTFNLFLKSYQEYNLVAKKLIDVIKEGNKGKVLEVQKIIHVSRGLFSSSSKPTNPIDSLLSIESPLYEAFREMALDVEEYVKKSKVEYVIVRGPSTVEPYREGSRFGLTLSQSDSTAITAQSVGVLDLSECVTQALILEVSNLTFSVSETSPENGGDNNFDKESETSQSDRVLRRAYYSILDMGNEELRSSLMIKPQEAYVAQIDEDRLVEKYWTSKFLQLKKDNMQ